MGNWVYESFHQLSCPLPHSNLKKSEEVIVRLEAEIAENEKLMEELMELLKKLEDEGEGILKTCREAEVFWYIHIIKPQAKVS